MDGRYSTHDLIAAERARESAQLNRTDERAGIASTRGLKAANAFSLNSGQREVVEAVFTSGNGVDVIESQAGVGKTFTAGAIRAVAEQDGRRVIGTAPTAVAALELQEQAGIESRTLHSLLGQLDRGKLQLGPRDVIVADEMGAAGTRIAAALEQQAQAAGCKLIEFQDSKQLQAVMAGGELQGVHEKLGGLKLDQIVRQRNSDERRAVAQLHAGNVDHWIKHQEERDRLHYGATVEQAVHAHRTNVAAVGAENAALIVPTNALARGCNDLVRDELVAEGRLAEERIVGGMPLAVGDRVVCGQNDSHLQVINSDRATVLRVRGGGVDVQLDRGGYKRHIPASYIEDGDLTHGYAATAHKSQGRTYDRVVMAGHADELYAELGYVAASRARDDTHFFVVGGEDIRDQERAEIGPVDRGQVLEQREVLAKTMLESRGELTAIEQLPERRLDRGLGLEL